MEENKKFAKLMELIVTLAKAIWALITFAKRKN